MANNLRIDPLGVFNFYLTLIDTSSVSGTLVSAAWNYLAAGFSECSGLEATVEVLEYKEGGVNDYTHKFPTRASFGNITLKHGVIPTDDDLWTWHNGFVLGNGTRRDGLIILMDESRIPAVVWKFTRGIPTKWVGPALNATQSAVAIESLEIAHEGLFRDLQVVA
jgi:phage tail-like protein